MGREVILWETEVKNPILRKVLGFVSLVLAVGLFIALKIHEKLRSQKKKK